MAKIIITIILVNIENQNKTSGLKDSVKDL